MADDVSSVNPGARILAAWGNTVAAAINALNDEVEALEGDVSDIEGDLGDLSGLFDPAGSATAALSAANSYTDSEISDLNIGTLTSAIANHISDEESAHTASAISFVPMEEGTPGDVSATNVQEAIEETYLEAVQYYLDSLTYADAAVTAHEAGFNPHPQYVTFAESEAIPIGVVFEYYGAAAPDGWGFADGQTYARLDFPYLADALAPDDTSPFWVNEDDFKVPDRRENFAAGKGSTAWADTLNETGGSKDAIVVSHEHAIPNHVHTITHTHSMTHTHPQHTDTVRADNTGNVDYNVQSAAFYGFSSGTPLLNTGASSAANTGGSSAANSGNPTTLPDTETVGSSGTNANLPPYIVCNYIIKMS